MYDLRWLSFGNHNRLITNCPSDCNNTVYRSGTVNSNMVNSKFHLIRSYCEIFFYHFTSISCLKYTVISNFHLIRSKTLPTNDFELTVPDLYCTIQCIVTCPWLSIKDIWLLWIQISTSADVYFGIIYQLQCHDKIGNIGLICLKISVLSVWILVGIPIKYLRIWCIRSVWKNWLKTRHISWIYPNSNNKKTGKNSLKSSQNIIIIHL